MLTFYVWRWTENRIHFYLGQINSGLERVAQVKSISNEVTRNHSGQLLWQEIESGEILYFGNSVQTQKESSAEIIFDDGEQILIGPESLVRFVREDSKISLLLVEGKIQIKSPSAEIQKEMRLTPKKSNRLFVSTPKGRLVLNNADLKIQIKKDAGLDNFKIEVIEGAPELITATDKKILTAETESEKIQILPTAVKQSSVIETAESQVITTKPQEAPIETSKKEEITTAIENRAATPQPTPITAEAPPEPTKPTEQRQPARAPLKAPKVKSIKVEAAE